ncbi:MAG TPA: DUF2116 family Zn-ribbon domain-containing protein [Lachnospiraceae bacterium]|nr:DUF2116 family Zn-ribbon domain-containing protein [Lachnospiraceae bacterium]
MVAEGVGRRLFVCLTSMNCTNCGTPIPEQSEFCPNCGNQCMTKKKGQSKKILFIVIGVVAVVVVVVLCAILLGGNMKKGGSDTEWGEGAMCELIPEFEASSYDHFACGDEFFYTKAYGIDRDDFEDDIEACNDARNAQDYYIIVSYCESYYNRIDVILYAPGG